MNEIVRSLRRGWEIVTRAPGVFVAAGAVWTVLVAVTAGLLVGPALASLVALALRVHEGRDVTISDAFAAFEDVAAPLAAGLVFWAPFALWGALSQGIGWVGAALTLALAVHFAYFVHAFSVIADRRAAPMEAFAAAVRLAEPPAAAGAEPERRSAAVTRHLAFGLILFVVLALAWAVAPWGFPFLLIGVGPLAAATLAAWHAQRTSPSRKGDEVDAGGHDELETRGQGDLDTRGDADVIEASAARPADAAPRARAATKKTTSAASRKRSPKKKAASRKRRSSSGSSGSSGSPSGPGSSTGDDGERS